MTDNKESSSSSSWLPWRKSANKNTDDKNKIEENKKTETTTTAPTTAPTTATEIATAAATTTAMTTDEINRQIEEIKTKNKEEKSQKIKDEGNQQPKTKKELQEEEERKMKKKIEKRNRFLIEEELNRKLDEKKNDMIDLVSEPPIFTIDLTPEDEKKLVFNRYGYACSPKAMLWRTGFIGGIAGALIGNSIAKTNPIKPLKTFIICVCAGTGGYLSSSCLYDNAEFRANYNHYLNNEYEVDIEDYFLSEATNLIIRRKLLQKNIKTNEHGRIIKQ
ncbi:hypothetical protein RB653_007911 [Dictyostelium firmibasis]|uniref:Uncharacterized protein n=1 Tax=Dictyostelium firmibasis TaxID=79012 RepID=A0AAN7TMK8_9MYCE